MAWRAGPENSSDQFGGWLRRPACGLKFDSRREGAGCKKRPNRDEGQSVSAVNRDGREGWRGGGGLGLNPSTSWPKAIGFINDGNDLAKWATVSGGGAWPVWGPENGGLGNPAIETASSSCVDWPAEIAS